jgi:hypothetical protein
MTHQQVLLVMVQPRPPLKFKLQHRLKLLQDQLYPL